MQKQAAAPCMTQNMLKLTDDPAWYMPDILVRLESAMVHAAFQV